MPKAKKNVRIESDSMGPLEVPASALWGAQTQRAVQNFAISSHRMPAQMIRALGLIKAAAAMVNVEHGHIKRGPGKAIELAAKEVARNKYDAQFPLDVFQTGSGTSTNMNANEVIAHLAGANGKYKIHPNDHVNFGQSSNDVIPTAIRVAVHLAYADQLEPALKGLRRSIMRRARALTKVAKTGRTHLMDAVPLTFGQEFYAWAAQLESANARFEDSLKRVRRLPIGGTAIGTELNSDIRFGHAMARALTTMTGEPFEEASNKFEGIAAQDDLVEFSGTLNALAVALMKISNDLRWMNSGPLAGLAEIELPSLQPGSSIMPGKVNPVIPEAVGMVCAQVMGQHTTVTVAGQSGNFQLNVMLPVIAYNVLESMTILSNAMNELAAKAIDGMVIREDHVAESLARNPILVTALNPIIGYEKAAQIAKKAYAERRPVLDVAIELSGVPEAKLRKLLDPTLLTKGGLQK